MYLHEGRQFRGMILPRADNTTSSNNTNSGGGVLNQSWTITVIVLVIVVVVLTAVLIFYSYLRKQRLQHKVPKFIPGPFLKRKWMAWKPRGKYSTIDNEDTTTTRRPTRQLSQATVVDRHTSVRSIMSLPAYSRTPKDTEEVIGREGERAGIDTVVEFPETVDEEEERREEEMESLYQIRQTRRREIADRDERRRERREAREAGDFARLEQLRQDARERRDRSQNENVATAETLIAEHNSRGRERRVSSVSYAAVGQVRHDGSRARAGSRESNRPLLGQAAAMGSSSASQHSRQASDATSFLTMNDVPRFGNRHRSDSGAASISSVTSSFDNVSRSEVRPVITNTTQSSRRNVAGSITSTDSQEADVVDERVDPSQNSTIPLPPVYDAHDWGDAPEYEERQRLARLSMIVSEDGQPGDRDSLIRNDTRPPQLSALQTATPTINVQIPTQPNSPAPIRSAGGFSPVTSDHPELRS